MCPTAPRVTSELDKCGCTYYVPGSPSGVIRIQNLASVAAHYVPGSPSGVIRAWQVWLHIMCLAALQALSELGKCGCTLCAWQPFRRYQSLASVAAHYVPGSPSGVIRAWQAWLHIMCWQPFRRYQSLASVAAHYVPGSPSGVIRTWPPVWLHIMCLAALQALSELGQCGCTLCAWQPFIQALSELGKRGCTLCAWQPSGVIRAWQAWLHIMCLAAPQA